MRAFSLAVALLAVRMAGATIPAITPDDVAQFRAAAADPNVSSPSFLAAAGLIQAIGRLGDPRTLVPVLVELRDPRLMDAFKQGRYARGALDSEFQDLAERVAADLSFDATDAGRRTRQGLFDVVRVDYGSTGLFEAVFAIDSRAWQARRRTPGGTPPVLITGPIGKLAAYRVPDQGAQIAALVPLLDDACEGPDLIDVLARSPPSAPFAALRELYLKSRVSKEGCALHVARLLPLIGTRAAAETLRDRILALLRTPVNETRDQEITETVTLMGPIVAGAQIDLASLRGALLTAPLGPTLRINAGSFLDQAIMKNRRAREYSPENLAYWIGEAQDHVVSDFLRHGVDVNPTDKTLGTPLARALYPRSSGSRETQRELVATLLARGARVSEPEANGATPLDYAAAFWDLEEVRLLVEHGADVDARQAGHCSPPLLWAQSRPDVVLFLLDHGANIDARACDGSTVLLKAIEYNNPTLAHQLIERRADVTLGSKDRLTPLLIVHLRGNPTDLELEKELRGRGARLNPLDVAIWRAKSWMLSGGYP
jgi:hypothetical protein